MPVLEQTIELSFDHPSHDPPPRESKWQHILDAVFQIAGAGPVGFEQVRVLPPRKRPANLDVPELLVLDVRAMLGNPADAERSAADRKLDLPAVLNATRLAHHTHALSRWSEPLQCVRRLVPTEDPLDRGRNARAPYELPRLHADLQFDTPSRRFDTASRRFDTPRRRVKC